MLLGPHSSFKTWLQIPGPSYHQKVGTLPCLNLSSIVDCFDRYREAEVMLSGVWGQVINSQAASPLSTGLPRGRHIVRRPKLHGETTCGHSSCIQISSPLAQAPFMWMKKLSGDYTPRHPSHSQLFAFSQIRPQIMRNREKPAPLYTV